MRNAEKPQVFYKLNQFQGWISHIQGDREKNHKLEIIWSEACVEWTFFYLSPNSWCHEFYPGRV